MKKALIFPLLFLISNFASAEVQVHCRGKVDIFTNIDGEEREFKGELVWDLDGGNNNYFSLSGHYSVEGKTYPIDRTVRATISLISGTRSLYEITPVKTIIQQMDELPPSLEGSFMFKQPRVYRIKKTLTNAYLVSNAYAPVFICHET